MINAFTIGAALLLATAAGWDLARYRIPNTLCAALAGLFALRVLLVPEPALAFHLAAAALVFAGGVVLFARGQFGGGDVKLLTVAVLWVRPDLVPMQIAVMAMTGALLALALVAVRRIVRDRPPAPPRLFVAGAPVPYGVAIAVATVAYLPLG